MRAPIRRSVRHKTLLTLSRLFRNGLRPHARSGGDAACQEGRFAWTQRALIAAIAAAAGSPAFADAPAGRVVLYGYRLATARMFGACSVARSCSVWESSWADKEVSHACRGSLFD